MIKVHKTEKVISMILEHNKSYSFNYEGYVYIGKYDIKNNELSTKGARFSVNHCTDIHENS